MYEKYIKRCIDVIGASMGLLIGAPIMLALAICIRIRLGRPVIFKQKRAGKDGRIFCIYKFRTMQEWKDDQDQYLPDQQRMTALGEKLRSLSLDELPELINILKGDISFVGPRPLPEEYLPYYDACEAKRHRVRGGLIPPEVLYDNIMPTWKEQFAFETAYADEVCFLLDVKIVWSALRNIRKRSREHYGGYARESFYERNSL